MTATGTELWPTWLDDDHAVALLRRMVELPSPSGCEAEVATFLAGVMRELGYSVTRDDVGNVIGSLGHPAEPETMLLGHMDTCGDELPVVLDDQQLTGRGTVDAKGPLAAMVVAGARAHAQAPEHSRVTVVGVVQEETPQSLGAVTIGRHRPTPASLIVGEPSGWSALVMAYKGKLDLRIAASVAAAHPTAPGTKATELVAQAWDALLDVLGVESGRSAYDEPGPALTWMEGDLHRCAAEFSIRTPPGFDEAGLVVELRARVPEVSVDVVGWAPAVEVDTRNVVCRSLRNAIREQDAAPKMKRKTATSDMNVLAQWWDVPMATYGPGDSRLDHSDEEHIPLDEYLHGVRTLTSAVVGIGRENGGRAPRRPALRPVDDGGPAGERGGTGRTTR